MDGIEVLLVIVVISLTVLLVIVGVQVVMILVGLRKALQRLNNILDDAILGGGLLRPGKLSGIIEMIKKRRVNEMRDG